MRESAVSSPPDVPVPADEGLPPLVVWVRDLDALRRAGMISAGDYYEQRAEKLGEMISRPRGLWLGPLVAAGSSASVVSSIMWLCTNSWQSTGMAAGLAALFGLAMLGRECRHQIRLSQVAAQRAILHTMLELDLLSAEDYLLYDERLLAGQ